MAVAQTSFPPKIGCDHMVSNISSLQNPHWKGPFVRYASILAPLFSCPGPFCGAGHFATHGLLAANTFVVGSPRRFHRSGLRLLGESAAGSGRRSGGGAGHQRFQAVFTGCLSRMAGKYGSFPAEMNFKGSMMWKPNPQFC